MQDKRLWRMQMRRLLRALPREEARRQSGEVLGRLEALPVFRRARVVVLFWSLADELPTHEFIARRAGEKTILLPCVEGDVLRLRAFCGEEKMRCGAFGIGEPDSPDFTDVDAIDLAVVPALAFDRQGNRLGRGRGFYDRLLPMLKAPKIGVCYDFQLVERLPVDAWDAPVDGVITHSATAGCRLFE